MESVENFGKNLKIGEKKFRVGGLKQGWLGDWNYRYFFIWFQVLVSYKVKIYCIFGIGDLIFF